jgi:iron complex outermembrane receptor protein
LGFEARWGVGGVACVDLMPIPLPVRLAGVVAVLLAPARASSQERADGGRRAGSIGGTVVDSATGAPLPAAQVRVLGLSRGELTHDDGRFTLEDLRPGAYTLIVQRLGYAPAERTVTLNAGSQATLRVALLASAASLAQVVVTGTLGERTASDAIRPTTALSGAALDRRLGETVATSLQGQPGVTVSGLGPATARPVIRGLSGDRVLVLEDGTRPGDLSSTSPDHAVAVDPLTARQLEVVRGPNSLLYGPSALGGVVNVVRDEIPTSPTEHAHGAATAQGSSVNRGATAGGYVALPFGHVGGGHLAVAPRGAPAPGATSAPRSARSATPTCAPTTARRAWRSSASAGTRAWPIARTPTTTESRAASSARTRTASTCACGATRCAPRPSGGGATARSRACSACRCPARA